MASDGDFRIYQFISAHPNWNIEADSNKDGAVVKSEFNDYILNHMTSWNGEEKMSGELQMDIINKFWNSINTNVKGNDPVNGISNRTQLSSDELAVIEKNKFIADIVSDYMDNKEPIGITNENYKTQWKNAMKTSLLNKAITDPDIANLKYDSQNTAELTSKINAFLPTVYDESNKVTSADYYKEQALDEILTGDNAKYLYASNKNGYSAREDETLKDITEAYINKIKSGSVNDDLSKIKDTIENIVKAYVATAKIGGDASAEDLTKYGYYGNGLKMNDLQNAVLSVDLEEQLTKLLGDEYKDYNNYYETNKADILAKIPGFIDEQFSSYNKDYSKMKDAINDLAKIFFEANIKPMVEQTQKDSGNSGLETKLPTADDVEDSLLEIEKKSATLAYRILDKGKIEFVEWKNTGDATGGIYSASADSTVNGYFNTVKTQLETSYSSALKSVFDSSVLSTMQDKLFNLALYMTLSDSSVVTDLYNETSLKGVVKALINNYKSLLEKAKTNETFKKYLGQAADLSLLAGRTLATEYKGQTKYIDDVNGSMSLTMNEFYKDNSTSGGDDFAIKIERLSEADSMTDTKDDVSNKYGIIHFTDKKIKKKDALQTNTALDKLVSSYISQYSSYIDSDRIIELFKQAETNAFNELKNVDNHVNASKSNTRLYGYSENGKTNDKNYVDYDTISKNNYFSVQAILLQVMYEMEALINKEMLKS